jgi:DNA-binding NarL/FixJ family response regulator
VGLVGGGVAVRAGLHVLLAERRRIEVVGEAASLADAGKLRGRCDVLVVCDPGSSGPEIASFETPPALLLLTSGPVEAARALELQQRPWGVLDADAGAAELRAAVAALAEGLSVAAPALLQGLLRRPPAPGGEPPARLSPRELEVLGLLAEGLANRQIAAALGISDHTVKFHVASLYAKLGAGNRIEAVQAGLRQGLLSV